MLPWLAQLARPAIASAMGMMARRRSGGSGTGDPARRDRPLRLVDAAVSEIGNSRDVLQHAIDVARDGMAIYDSDLRLIAWNAAYRDMFGLPDELMCVGVPLDRLVRSNAARGLYGAGDPDELTAERIETLMRPTDGMRLYGAPFGRVLEMRSVRMRSGGLFFTYTDATAQAKSEEHLEAENVTLERRVRERTEELEQLNFELAQAKAEAEDANVSKTRFLAAASHDLLQPLNAARLYATSLRERLRDTDTAGEPLRLAANVDASLEAVEDILGALLEITQLDAGATPIEIAPVDVGDLLKQIAIEFQPAAAERGLRLRIVPSTLVVMSDRRLLRRLLQNLVSNAIKYTRAGDVLVGARRRGGSVRLDVHDTGPGIPKSKHLLVFREFERLPTARDAPGAGLGLSIVERLSRLLGHEVALVSEVGRGSRFSVTIPRVETTAARETPDLPAPRQRSLGGLTIAAIDNESHVLEGMEVLLRGWDCSVAVGTDLGDIERSLQTLDRPPDVIVADYHIGEQDGLAAIAALRRRFGPLPAVLITADRAPVIRTLAQEADVRVLNKPLKPAALRSLLTQWHLLRRPGD